MTEHIFSQTQLRLRRYYKIYNKQTEQTSTTTSDK